MLEEGDYDEVDEEALRDEVGRIHQRQLLDEDQREIRSKFFHKLLLC